MSLTYMKIGDSEGDDKASPVKSFMIQAWHLKYRLMF